MKKGCIMRYNILGGFAVLFAAVSGHADGIPVEWNVNRTADVPY